MRDLNELNLNEGGRRVAALPPTAHQLAVVEQLVGATLPETYIRFLQFSNGGHPERNLFEIERDGQRFGWGVNSFFHIASDVETTDDVGDVVWNYHHRWPGTPRELLPIARDGGGNLF